MSNFIIEARHPHSASLLQKIAAYFIDLFITIAVAILINVFWGETLTPHIDFKFTTELGKRAFELIEHYSHFGFLFIFTYLMMMFRDIVNGRSFGKRILHLHIISKTSGKDCGVIRSIMRSSFLYILLIALLFPFIQTEIVLALWTLFMLSDVMLLSVQSNHRTVGDIVTHTMIIYQPSKK
jgi:hypothetical protein